MLLFPVALPVTMQTTRATPSEPFLGIRLDLDSRRISELVLKVYAHGLPPLGQRSAGYAANAGLSIMKAVSRLLDCLSDPGDTEWIAPLVMDEILIRILRSPFGKQVAEMGFVDSGVQRVAKAIDWLRSNFSQQMKVTDLADLMHMSVSSFNEHFKSVHGDGDKGLVPTLIDVARRTGVSAYVGDGTNRWPAVHRLDAAKLYRLALESASAGTRLHAIGDEGVALRDIAALIGRRLNVPVVSKSPEEAVDHFNWLMHFVMMDNPASSALTQERFEWRPGQLTLLSDIDRQAYFGN